MQGVLVLSATKLLELQFLCVCFGVLGGAVVDLLTPQTLQTYLNFHNDPLTTQ